VLDAMRDREDCQREGQLLAIRFWLLTVFCFDPEPRTNPQELHSRYFPSPSLNMYLIEGL